MRLRLDDLSLLVLLLLMPLLLPKCPANRAWSRSAPATARDAAALDRPAGKKPAGLNAWTWLAAKINKVKSMP